MNVDGVEVANYGVEKQGWFDHWSYFFGLKRAAINRKVDFIDGELVDFEFQTQTTLSSEAGEIYFYPRLAKVFIINLPLTYILSKSFFYQRTSLY